MLDYVHTYLFIIVFRFACLESTSRIFIIVYQYSNFPQSVILLEVSIDLRLSWSVSRLSIVNRHSIEITTNAHEYL
jgi:hypothetical protein